MKLQKQTFGIDSRYLEMIRDEVQESKRSSAGRWKSQNEIMRLMLENRYGPLEDDK